VFKETIITVLKLSNTNHSPILLLISLWTSVLMIDRYRFQCQTTVPA